MQDAYTCPAGKTLTTTGHVSPDHSLQYLGSVPQCRACTSKRSVAQKSQRDGWNSIMPMRPHAMSLESLAKTPAFAQSRRDRKKVEMLFAHLKRILRLDRLHLRGPSGAQFEFTLAAIAQNLRRLAKLVARPPPVASRHVLPRKSSVRGARSSRRASPAVPQRPGRKTIVPARPKNPTTPRKTCKTDLCNKIGHKRTLSGPFNFCLRDAKKAGRLMNDGPRVLQSSERTSTSAQRF